MWTMRFACVTAGFVVFLTAPAFGATFNVTNQADAHDLVPGNGTCSSGNSGCTLRAAIEETNALASADVINVPAGVYLLSLGSLWVTDDVRILGTYPASIDAQLLNTVFVVDQPRAQIHVEFHHLDIRNGNTGGSGGGIWNGERLLINKCSIYQNRADIGGGGIHNNSSGTISIVRSSIHQNGHMIDEDAVPQRGGGLQNGGIVYVDMSTFSTNAAERAGGIFQGGGSYLIMRNSTVSANIGTIDTGGVLNGGTVYMNNVTVAFNAGLTKPYQEYDDDASGGVSGSGEMHLANTIVARNEFGPEPVGYGLQLDCAGTIISAGHNLIEDTSACTIDGDLTGNILGEDPNLGTLQLNGGDTKNHALPADSPAVNAGNPGTPDGLGSHCEPADQRYRMRGKGPNVGRCDIGAYERNAMPGEVGVGVRPPD